MLGLSNRETATIIWLGVVAVFILASRATREMIPGLLHIALGRKFLIPLLAFTGYIAAVVCAARLAGLWEPSLTATTVFWFITVALGLFLGSNDAVKEKAYYRRIIAGTVGGLAVLEILASLYSLPIAVEFILQGLIAFLAVLAVAATTSPKGSGVGTFSNILIVVAGLALVVASVAHFVSDVVESRIDWPTLGRTSFLPIWMTLAAVLFLWPLSLMMAYEGAFRLLRNTGVSGRGAWRARLALILVCGPRTTHVGQATGALMGAMARAPSIRASIFEYRHWRGKEEERLRPLAPDEAEAKATRESLRWLSTCHMGWHKNRGGTYRPDLMELVQNRFVELGLPAEHGVHHRVAADQKAWISWRRLSDGRCVGIGANDVPQEEWRFEGTMPPAGFASKPGWKAVFDFDEEGSFWY